MNNFFPKTESGLGDFACVSFFVEIEIKIDVINICFLQKILLSLHPQTTPANRIDLMGCVKLYIVNGKL